MIGMRKGLFGRGLPGAITGYGGGTFNMDGTQAAPMSMPQDMTMRDGAANLAQGQPQARQPSFWMGGDKFTGRDALAGAMAAVGDALANEYGGSGGAVQGLVQSRMLPQQQAMMLAEDQRRRAADLADFRAQQQIKAEFEAPDAPKPGSFEWFQTATPEQVTQYNAYMDITNPVMTTTWQGPTIIPRSSRGAVPSAPVGKLTPIQPNITNTPAPQLGANGMPTRLTRQQYQAVVNEMGQAETEAWARRNNIMVVN